MPHIRKIAFWNGINLLLVDFQRFNFLNGLDCPDWLLAQIAEITKMVKTVGILHWFWFLQTTIKYKLLCALVLNRLSRASDHEVAVTSYVNELLGFYKFTESLVSISLDEESIKRIITSTSYIMENTLLSATSASDLILELEQLGMTSGTKYSSPLGTMRVFGNVYIFRT